MNFRSRNLSIYAVIVTGAVVLFIAVGGAIVVDGRQAFSGYLKAVYATFTSLVVRCC